jgi:hypothetical protein
VKIGETINGIRIMELSTILGLLTPYLLPTQGERWEVNTGTHPINLRIPYRSFA